MAQHTPGPWVWDGHSLRAESPDPDISAVHTILEAEHLGAGFLFSDHAETRAELDNNLQLIAAAPDLAKALAGLLAVIGDAETPEHAVHIAICEAALKKAGVMS